MISVLVSTNLKSITRRGFAVDVLRFIVYPCENPAGTKGVLLLSNVSQRGRCVFNNNVLVPLNATSGKGRDVAAK